MDENYYMLIGFLIITNLFWIIMFNISFYKENRWYKEYRELERRIRKSKWYFYEAINNKGANMKTFFDILEGDDKE